MTGFEASLRVLTLNIWGLPFARDHSLRVRALSRKLSELSLDVIGLQEAWLPADRQVLAACLARSGVRYSHYFRSGLLGSGLYTLSRFPIVAVDFQRYFLSGSAENLLDGEYFSGKGIGLVRIQSPYGLIDVYNTQPVAQYAPDQDDLYQVHRSAAMLEAARFILSHSPSNAVIALGDFNVRPDQFAYQVITHAAGLSDCYPILHPDDLGETITPQNPYKPKEFAKRIDYIFIRDGQTVTIQPTVGGTVLKQIPGSGGMFYSDHYGVQMDLRLKAGAHAPAAQAGASNEKEKTLTELRLLFEKAAAAAADQRQPRLRRALAGVLLALSLRLIPLKSTRTLPVLHGLTIVYAVFQAWLALFVSPQEQKFLNAQKEEVDRLIDL